MTESTVVFRPSPEGVEDPLTEVLRAGARELVRQAVEAELGALLAAYEEERTETGRRRLVRHGHGPERTILTGIGPVPVRRPKVRDRVGVGEGRIRFSSRLLPRFARRTRSLDAALPTLYLLGVSSGDFGEALAELLGAGASGLSPGVIGRLKAEWEAEHERWRGRNLSDRRYVYVWADGIYLQGRLEDEKQCVLVVIGATPEGKNVPFALRDDWGCPWGRATRWRTLDCMAEVLFRAGRGAQEDTRMGVSPDGVPSPGATRRAAMRAPVTSAVPVRSGAGRLPPRRRRPTCAVPFSWSPGS